MNPLKLYNVAFTGPRNIITSDWAGLNRGLSALRAMPGPLVLHTGGASGFDTAVFRALRLHPNVHNVLHIPFTYQQQELFQAVPDTAEFSMCPLCGPIVFNPSLKYLYQKRNEHMVDSAQLLVYYNPWGKGGTQNCIDYAKTTGIEMVSILDL